MKKKRSVYFRLFFMLMGSALASIALECLLIPNHIIDGGIVGISIMLSHISHIPLGIFTFLLNIPFLIIGYRRMGKTFALSTLFAITTLSIGLNFAKLIPVITHDVLLATVFGGICMGVGCGLILRNGASTDGMDVLAVILDKKTSFSVGEIIMFFNLFILGISGLVFGFDKAAYSLITYFIVFKVIDIVVQGLDETKSVLIISDKYELLSTALQTTLGRSVTLLEGKGGYSQNPTNIIYVIISRLETSKLKNLVKEIDKNALMIVGSVEASGKALNKKWVTNQ
ncbi:YitT family protein (plasmid) [Aneurinibacillus sp. Ricciae_BoGa-3]|uniref:YitT family protein n=1 Tax=Aneurinibacillus sp. Ricciae_BoGa-3 TaxID=3022697 RepID=UPI002340C332|nr:YitT family protein [Aneurinibacillus sp. Ricciae_BoGa-3]WCK57277.1 YitT family protein [Aneurinibacillus sp. Ricciae_BoGa-3]